MKAKSLIDKFVFFVNSLFAIALLLAYILPFIPPRYFPFLSILSLGVPILIITNFLFLVFWAIRVKRQVFLSLIVLLLGLHHVFALFSFSLEKKEASQEKGEVSVMSYNVRMFNKYLWLDKKEVPQQMKKFIESQSPDILCVQDYYKTDSIHINEFRYSYIKTKDENATLGHAIFSDFPIINKGSLNFPDTYNNAIFADIVVGNDTLRVFNIHLESLKIIPKKVLNKAVTEKLVHRVGGAFVMQQEQIEMVLDAIDTTPYKSILCADMNNSAFSYVYRKIEGQGFKDAFKEAGNGFGKTFDFEFIPLRIDMIFVAAPIEVTDFKNYRIKLSDHYPIMARIKL